jgi:hypothetical protein
MVKMKIYSDLEAQQLAKLNEFFLVVDRIREAGCDAKQGFGKLKGNKLNLSSGGGARAPPLTSNGISIIASRSSDLPT